MPKLIPLTNGEWIDPLMVDGIQIIHDHKSPPGPSILQIRVAYSETTFRVEVARESASQEAELLALRVNEAHRNRNQFVNFPAFSIPQPSEPSSPNPTSGNY